MVYSRPFGFIIRYCARYGRTEKPGEALWEPTEMNMEKRGAGRAKKLKLGTVKARSAMRLGSRKPLSF